MPRPSPTSSNHTSMSSQAEKPNSIQACLNHHKAMRTCILLLVAIAAAAVFAAATTTPAVGGWGVIPDVEDAHVQEIGAWAVAEHVKRANDGLKFGRVASGEEQLVSGVNYRLDIVAVNLAGQNATYNAVVYEQIWTNTRQLRSFDRAK